jgi:hypothetical protein
VAINESLTVVGICCEPVEGIWGRRGYGGVGDVMELWWSV